MAQAKFIPFNKFACVGDTATFEAGPFKVIFELHYDEDSKPSDCDCYTQEQVDAWRNDEWQFVGVQASLYVNGVCVEDWAASLWGIECGFSDEGDGYLNTVAGELLREIDFKAYSDKLAQAAFDARAMLGQFAIKLPSEVAAA